MTLPSDFTDLNTRDEIRARWWLEIEGLRYRYSTWTPEWNPADTGTNQPLKDYIAAIPNIGAQVAHPLDGRSDPASFSVALVDIDDYLTELFSFHYIGSESLLAEDLDSSETEIDVVDGSVFAEGDDIYIDRETMVVSGVAANTLTVTRGCYGSIATEHSLTDINGNSREVWVTDTPKFIHTRKAWLYETRSGLDEADSIVFVGVVDSLSEEDGVWSIGVKGSLSLLDAQICEGLPSTPLAGGIVGHDADTQKYIITEDENGTLYDSMNPTGGVPLTYSGFLVGYGESSNFPSSGSVCIGNEIMYYVDTDNVAPYDFFKFSASSTITSQTSPIDNRGMFYYDIYGVQNAPDYILQLLEMGQEVPFSRWKYEHFAGDMVRQVITHRDFAALVDPISVALCIMLSKTGDGSNHATYDILPPGCGLGLDSALIDVTGFEAMRDALGLNGFEIKFCIPKPVNAKTWLEQNIFRPLMIFPSQDYEGKITIKRIVPYNYAYRATGYDLIVNKNNLLSLPKVIMGEMPIGQIIWKVNKHPIENDYFCDYTMVLGETVDRYAGQARKVELKCDAIYDNKLPIGNTTSMGSAGAIHPFLRNYADIIWHRYANAPIIKYELELPYNYLTDLALGNVILLTATTMPNLRGQSRSVTNEYCQVIEVHPNIQQSSVRVIVLNINAFSQTRRIAPSGEVSAYAAAGGVGGRPRVTLKTTFSGSGGDNAAIYFEEDDEIIFVDSEYVALGGGATPERATIYAVGADYVDLDAGDGPTNVPGDGDFIDTAVYDNVQRSQRDNWGFQADSSDTLGTAADDAHERE